MCGKTLVVLACGLGLVLSAPPLTADQSAIKQLQEQLLRVPDATARERAIEDFIALIRKAGTPLVESNRATFLFRGKSGSRVFLAGDLTNWRPDQLAMQELDQTGIYQLELELPHASRWEYKLVADGHWFLDPWNPRVLSNGVGGENSFFTMPGYVEPPEVADDASLPQGSIELMSVPSAGLGGERAVYVYRPANLPAGAKLQSLYVQDGQEYLTRVHLPRILDFLIAHRQIPPLIAVLIEPQDRMKEYWLNDAYLRFLTTELVPMIDARFPTDARPVSRTVAGASLGGLIAAYTALEHPEVFGKVISQSGAFFLDHSKLVNLYRERAPNGLVVDLTVGKFEGELLESNHALGAVLREKHIRHFYREFDGGHNWISWRDQIGQSLRAVLGPAPAGN